MRIKRHRRDPNERALAVSKKRPPSLYTLYSKDLRIDLMIGSPRVLKKERHVRQPFDPITRTGFEQEPHYAHYFPTRVRVSWASTPKEPVLLMKDRDILVESVRQLSSIPRGSVWDAAALAVEDYVHGHPAQRQRYVDYDPASRGVNVSWEVPTPRHMLASGGARTKGQVTPRAVRFRIKLLLDQAETSTGFQAESAREKAEKLIREYELTEDEVRALQTEFHTRPAGETASRSLLGGGRKEAPSSRRLPPRRDRTRSRTRRDR